MKSIFLLLGGVALLGWSSAGFAEDPLSIKSVLGMFSEQYQSGTFVWDVQQTQHFEKDDFEAGTARLAEEARRTPPGYQKENLLVTKRAIESLRGQDVSDEILFTASFANGGRFKVSQKFLRSDNLGEEIQYLSDGDGLSYTVREQLKRVTISDKPEEIVRLLLRSRVDLFLEHALSSTEAPTVSSSGGQLLYAVGNDRAYKLEVLVDQKSHSLRSVTEKSNGVVLRSYQCSEESFPGTLLPLTVTFEEFNNGNPRLKQLWKLTKVATPLDPTMIATDYQLKPKYTVIDITNNGMRQFKSEEWLPKKSGQ